MTLAQLLNQPLTITHVGATAGKDRYGNLIEGATGSDDVVGYLEQTDATELLVGAERYTSTWQCFLPADTTIGPADRIVDANGATFEVLGPPEHAYNPRTRQFSHIRCKLRVTTG